jgi:hypothetical protein
MESGYEIVAPIVHDIDAEIARCTPGPYADGLAAAGAIVRAHAAGLARTRSAGTHGHRGDRRGGGGGGGGDDPPAPTKPPSGDGGGRVIEADYDIVAPEKERVSLAKPS